MRKAIVPVYQPIVDIDSGQVLHYEALARVRNGQSSHGRLIELGECIGFVDLIDIAMLEHVVDTLNANPSALVSVNVSGVTIEQSCNELLAVIFKHMDVMRRVVFEITETSRISNTRLLNRFLMAIRILDARVALDDYGTGFCTMDFVRQVKPEFVKLAGSLVEHLVTSGHLGQISEVCEFVKSYGGEMIAEHIDSQLKFDAMQSMGIRYLQGYHVGGLVMNLAGVDSHYVAVNRSRPQLAVVTG